MAEYDRIRVLLVDDFPDFAMVPFDFVRDQFGADSADAMKNGNGNGSRRVVGVWSVADPRLERYFEAKLLESAEAAKEYRDLCLRLETMRQGGLGERGWIPEVVLIDYDLGQKQFKPSDLGATWNITSPLVRLRQAIKEAGHGGPPKPQEKPTIEVPFGERDRSGCYVGGLIAASFAAHPCVPVPTTVQTDAQVGRDALFFEWFLGDQFFDAWDNRGAITRDMREVIAKGVRNLKRRIEELLRGGLILVSLDDLSRAADATELGGCVIRVESAFGVRRLPLEGLFVDHPLEDSVREANAWANTLLEVALSGPYRTHFAQGKELAERLWNRYDSQECVERYRLGSMYGLSSLSGDDAAERRRLVDKFGAVGKGKTARCTKGCFDIETVKSAGGAYSERARRWAALFVLVYLSKRATDSANAWKKICFDHKISLGSIVPELLDTDVQLNDAYVALFPCPEQPVTIDKTTMSGAFLQRLKRIGDRIIKKKGSAGDRDLALKLSDVWAAKDWDAKKGVYGLMPGERRLLQSFAMDCGFAREMWPGWLAGSEGDSHG